MFNFIDRAMALLENIFEYQKMMLDEVRDLKDYVARLEDDLSNKTLTYIAPLGELEEEVVDVPVPNQDWLKTPIRTSIPIVQKKKREEKKINEDDLILVKKTFRIMQREGWTMSKTEKIIGTRKGYLSGLKYKLAKNNFKLLNIESRQLLKYFIDKLWENTTQPTRQAKN